MPSEKKCVQDEVRMGEEALDRQEDEVNEMSEEVAAVEDPVNDQVTDALCEVRK